LIVIFFRYKKC